MKKVLLVLAVMAMVFAALFALPAIAEENEEEIFAEWNPDAPALQTLIDFVEAVTDENSPDYIPPVDRIAVFDMDGTLCGELYPTYLEYYLLARRIFCDPSYTPDEEMLEFGRVLRDHALDKSFPDHMDLLHANAAAKAYAGMTLTQFADFVTNELVREVDGFEGMTYANTIYLPMIEVVEYLEENGFKVYVVSGSDRFICRTFLEGMLDVPYEQIIGMDVVLEATHQEGTDGLDYLFTSEDNIVRTDELIIKNLKMNKVKQIVQEIGRQPVLAFGNSSGDMSMHNYTIHNNRYRSAAFMLIADDEERDYGNTEKAQELRQKWEAAGYNVISMKDDFRTIYGDSVVKTGTFHWMEEFAEEAPAEQPADESAPAADGIPQPDGGKKFEGNWAVMGAMVNIVYEEEGYRVYVEAYNPDEMKGEIWEYSCYYSEDKDALESIASLKRGYTLDTETLDQVYADSEYEGLDEAGMTTVFFLAENGKLIWADAHENAGADLEFRCIGDFEGVWQNEAEEVYAEISWDGFTNEETFFYTVYIRRGGEEQFTEFSMTGNYNTETGRLEAKGTAVSMTKNAEGSYDAVDDDEEYDAFFSKTEDGKLLFETANGIELDYVDAVVENG